ncbi:MAG: crossover junction endodeoxyribonuclease RuvC [Planctomycetota bacterium]|jgi:Holliday junction resolvasome RuvABC endonuclease subunit
MVKQTITVIGINPGTRYLGISVFHETELRDWRVKVIKGKCQKEKIERGMMVVSSFIEEHKPDALAIKRIHSSRSSQDLNMLVTKIKEFSRRKKLKVYEYSIKELETFFSTEGKTNKKKMVEMIALKYPDLSNEFNREKKQKNPYHTRMFEAVALGSICVYQLSDKN